MERNQELKIQEVGQEEVETVAELAREIWTSHYGPIIGQEQVDYMLDKFQSPAAINAQLKEGYEYYLLLVNEKSVGYLALVAEGSGLKISKIYVREDYRGRGCGTQLLDYACQQARKQDLERLWLRVNKQNDASIQWYKSKGFTKIKEAKKLIGEGFYMDDYIMEKKLKE